MSPFCTDTYLSCQGLLAYTSHISPGPGQGPTDAMMCTSAVCERPRAARCRGLGVSERPAWATHGHAHLHRNVRPQAPAGICHVHSPVQAHHVSAGAAQPLQEAAAAVGIHRDRNRRVL